MSGQNRSSAVMQQRIEPDDSLDDFPTPPWATRAAIEHVLMPLFPGLGTMNALEPCCNRGFMARPMQEYFGRVFTSDVHHYGWEGQMAVADFLYPGYRAPGEVDLILANPPFRLAEQFIRKAVQIADSGCGMFVRNAFIEGEERYRSLFRDNPPTIIAQFAERVVLHKGVLRCPDVKYWDPQGLDKKTGGSTGAWKRPSSATAYCWLFWLPRLARQPQIWIPPCRQKMERAGDYPGNPDERKDDAS